jgi:hypothetical protein
MKDLGKKAVEKEKRKYTLIPYPPIGNPHYTLHLEGKGN